MPTKAKQIGDDRDLPTVTTKSSGISYLTNQVNPRQDGAVENRDDSTLNDNEAAEGNLS